MIAYQSPRRRNQSQEQNEKPKYGFCFEETSRSSPATTGKSRLFVD